MKQINYIINSKNYPVWLVLTAVFFAGITGVFDQGVPFAPYSEIHIEQIYQENSNKRTLQFHQPPAPDKKPNNRKIYVFRIAEFNQTESIKLRNSDSKSLEIFDFKLQHLVTVEAQNTLPLIS